MRKAIIILVLFTLSIGDSFSQSIGYMGDKITLGIGIHGMPKIPKYIPKTMPFQRDIDKIKKIYLNMGLNLAGTYTISRKTNIEVSYTYQPLTRWVPPVSISHHTLSDLEVFFLDDDLLQMASSKVSIGFQFFRGSYIAPLGRYIELGITHNQIKASNNQEVIYADQFIDADPYNQGDTNDTEYVAINVQNNNIDGKHTNISPFIGFGYTQRRDNGMFLGLNMRLAYPLGFSFKAIDVRTRRTTVIRVENDPETRIVYSSNISEDTNIRNYKDYINAYIKRYHYQTQFLTARFSVGYVF